MVKIAKNPGIGRLNNLNDPSRPQCVKFIVNMTTCMLTCLMSPSNYMDLKYNKIKIYFFKID